MKIINCKFSKEQYPVFIGDTVLTDASIWKPYLKNIVDNNDRCNEATQNSQVAINRSSQEESSETQPLLPSRSNNNEAEINDVSASSNNSPNPSDDSNLGMLNLGSLMQGVDLIKAKGGLKKVKKSKYLE